MSEQEREYYGGATGDGLTYDADEDRWEPTPITEVAGIVAIEARVSDAEAAIDALESAEPATSTGSANASDLATLQAQYLELRSYFRLLLQDYIPKLGAVPKLGVENFRALQEDETFNSPALDEAEEEDDEESSDIEFPLDLDLGGTGAITAEDARANLEAAAAVHTHNADEVTAGVFAVARLGSGTPDSTKYLRGDGTWTVPPTAGLVPLSLQRQTAGATLSYAVAGGLFSATTHVLEVELQTFTGTSGAVTVTISFGGVTIFTLGSVAANQELTWIIRIGYLTDTTFWCSQFRAAASSIGQNQDESLTMVTGFAAGPTFTSTMTGGTNPCSRVLEVAKRSY